MSAEVTLSIALPREFLTLLGAPSQAAEAAREYIVLGLFQEGRISTGKAAELLGLTYRGFVRLMARKGIPYFRLDPEEWEAEIARLHLPSQPDNEAGN